MTSHQDRTITARLIRHGQSTSNAGRETTDPAMIPLSDTGEQQADVVARSFDRSPDLIVTSSFLRTRDTAVPTTRRFPSVPVTQWPVEEFTYLGRLHGRRTTGLERRPLVDAYWQATDPRYVDDDKSESFEGVCDRARWLLTQLSQRSGTVAVFTHGLFMRVVLWVLLARDTAANAEGMRRFDGFRTAYLIPNCSIITLSLHPELGWRALGATVGHLPESLRTGE
jgi:probable phosphoglycerate mutase